MRGSDDTHFFENKKMGTLFEPLWRSVCTMWEILVFILLICISDIMEAGITVSSRDRKHMQRAVELAAQARGQAAPNPCVGCVIVDKDGNVVGEGWHRKAGQAHAEVNALQQAGDSAVGGTAYVSLEPCNHFGRTPPCTHALVNASIARVCVGMVDPDPRVSGSGLKFLTGRGVQVSLGVEEELCKDLNRAFVFRVLNGRPFVTIWAALSGKSAVAENEAGAFTAPNIADLAALIDSTSRDVDTVLVESGDVDVLAPHVERLPLHVNVAVLCRDPGEVDSIAKSLLERRRTSLQSPSSSSDTDSEVRRWSILYAAGSNEKDKLVRDGDMACTSFRRCSQPATDDCEAWLRRVEVADLDHFDACLTCLADGGCNSLLVLCKSRHDLVFYAESSAMQRTLVSPASKYLGAKYRGCSMDQMRTFRQILQSQCPRGIQNTAVDFEKLCTDDCIEEFRLGQRRAFVIGAWRQK